MITSIFCFIQVANASNAVKSEMNAFEFESQIESLLSEDASGQSKLETALDQAIQENKVQADADQSALLATNHSHRWARVKNRWSKRLHKRADSQVNRFSNELNQETDESLQAQIASEIKKASLKNQDAKVRELTILASNSKENLKAAAVANLSAHLTKMADTTAISIANKGGIIPFLTHVKGAVHQEALSAKAKKGGRAIASIWNDGYSTTVEILLALVALGFIVVAGLAMTVLDGGALILVMFACAGLDALFINYTGVGRK